MTESELRELFWRTGPLTGAELLERTRTEALPLWRMCRRTPALQRIPCGRRYLRLDRVVEGYARLSPSIRREFLTYTVLGLREHGAAVNRKAEEVRREIAAISQAKINLAREIAVAVVEETGQTECLLEQACFLIAGDVIYNMAHRVPRPEKSTGEMVRGSDLDIVIIVEEGFPADLLERLDRAIYRKKHYVLVHPDYREEVDYLIKDLQRVREQMAFDTFEAMVACKIMDESQLLYGSRALFQRVKALLQQYGIPQRLAHLETLAVAERDQAEQSLLAPEERARMEDYHRLFFTQEEGEEIY